MRGGVVLIWPAHLAVDAPIGAAIGKFPSGLSVKKKREKRKKEIYPRTVNSEKSFPSRVLHLVQFIPCVYFSVCVFEVITFHPTLLNTWCACRRVSVSVISLFAY